MKVSSFFAALALSIGVPACFGLAILGSRSGYYQYEAVPFVGAFLLLIVYGLLLYFLPLLRAQEDRQRR